MLFKDFPFNTVYFHEVLDEIFHVKNPFAGLDARQADVFDPVTVLAKTYESFQGLYMFLIIIVPDLMAVKCDFSDTT